jgi:hypothetical protein
MEEVAAGQFESPSGMNDNNALGLLAGDLFDGSNRHRHGEQLADFGFVDVQGHALPPLEGNFPGTGWNAFNLKPVAAIVP